MIEIECKNKASYITYVIKGTDILHREDGPAIIWVDGITQWYQHGQLHRLDGPAVNEFNNKNLWYYKNKWIDCSSQDEFERLVKLKIFW